MPTASAILLIRLVRLFGVLANKTTKLPSLFVADRISSDSMPSALHFSRSDTQFLGSNLRSACATLLFGATLTLYFSPSFSASTSPNLVEILNHLSPPPFLA